MYLTLRHFYSGFHPQFHHLALVSNLLRNILIFFRRSVLICNYVVIRIVWHAVLLVIVTTIIVYYFVSFHFLFQFVFCVSYSFFFLITITFQLFLSIKKTKFVQLYSLFFVIINNKLKFSKRGRGKKCDLSHF